MAQHSQETHSPHGGDEAGHGDGQLTFGDLHLLPVDPSGVRERTYDEVTGTAPSPAIREPQPGENEKAFEQRRITWLRDQYAEHGLSPELVGDMHFVARDMVVSALVSSAGPLKRTQLKRYLKNLTHEQKSFKVADIGDGIDGMYDYDSRTLMVNGAQYSQRDKLGIDIYDRLPEKMRAGFHASGVDDLSFLLLFHTVAHETGHSLLSDIGENFPGFQVSDTERQLEVKASAVFMKRHPELGMTGNYEADCWNREEQFAEGFAQVATDRSMKHLGIRRKVAKQVKEAVSADTWFSGAAPTGHEQIDVLGSVSDTKGADVLVSKNANDVQRYSGALGYGLPLTVREIADQIIELAKTGAESALPEVDEKEWHALNRLHQTAAVGGYVAKLELDRANGVIGAMAPNVLAAHYTERRLHIRTALTSGVAIGAAAALAAGVLFEGLIDTPRDQQRSQTTINHVGQLLQRSDIRLGKDGRIYDMQGNVILPGNDLDSDIVLVDKNAQQPPANG